MDGGSHRQEQYGPPSNPAGAGIGQHVTRQLPGGPIDRFQQAQVQQPQQSRPTAPESPDQPPTRGNSLPTYPGFEYAGSPSYNASSFQSSGPLQADSLQYQQGYPSDPTPQHTPQSTPQHHDQSGLAQRVQQQQQQYETNMVYNVTPQGQQQPPYAVASNVQPRQSAAIEVLASQFGVPHYFSPEAPAGANLPGQYLPGQVGPTPYSQPQSVMRAGVPTTFAETMPEFNSAVASEQVEPQNVPHESPKIEDAYNQYQHTLRQTFEYTRTGHLVEASQLLLEISDWLLTNVVELGLTRDEQELHDGRIKLWSEFNTCWLALCQKQKDMTMVIRQAGAPQGNLLTEDTLSKMGKELVRLCDKLEQYGLVDYQMGVWEEEILSVLFQCFDLLDEQADSSYSSTVRQDRELRSYHGEAPSPH